MPLPSRWQIGIYAIRNKLNDKVYVGSATRSLSMRWTEHRNQLINRRHFNKHLQSAWDIYGGATFEFLILEKCLPDEAIAREQHWIDWYKSYDRRYGYNSRPRAASNLGAVFGPQSDEAKAKKSESLKRAYQLQPRPPVSDEVRAKISSTQRGRKRSEEFKRKVSVGQMGHEVTAETRAKIGAANAIALKGRKGHPQSEETKARISAARKGMRLSQQTIEKIAATKKGKSWSLARRLAQFKNTK